MNVDELIRAAIAARKMSYSPYSKFKVGAALLGKSGRIYIGTNIENASYPATNCAERTAFFSAISEGEKEFSAIAIVGSFDDAETEFCYPCGICRQVMSEFCDEESFKVYVIKDVEDYKEYALKELLPFSFGSENIFVGS